MGIVQLKWFCFVLYYSYILTISNANNETYCDCYPFGTLETIEGQSICDNDTSDCLCYPNIKGKRCDSCEEGSYNIYTGRGCSKCLCNPLGSISNSCNNETGECECKTGFTGYRCDQCEALAYRSSSSTCQKCNCNEYGAIDPQCNAKGECTCQENVEGTLCDRCKKNTHGIEEGCIACPVCYGFVENSTTAFYKYLNTIQDIIEDIETDLPLRIQDYKHFLNEIKILKEKISKLLLAFEKGSEIDLSDTTINELHEQIKDFNNEIIAFQKLSEAFKSDQILSQLNIAKVTLNEATVLLTTCGDALEIATIISNNLNMHNETISKIAFDALANSQQIHEKAENITELATNTISVCKETCSAAEKLNAIQWQFKNDVESFDTEISNSTTGAKMMLNYLNKFREDVRSTRSKSEDLFAKSNKIEVFSTETVSANVQVIQDDFSVIGKVFKNLSAANKAVREMEKDGNIYLVIAEKKQQDLENKIKLTAIYENRADLAINTTNDVLEMAQKSLIQIEEYRVIKQSAEELLKEYPNIKYKVDTVLNNSQNIKMIFKEVSDTVQDLHKIQLNISEIVKLDATNKIIVENSFKRMEILEKEEEIISKELEASHGKLQDIKNDINDFTEFHNKIKHDIKRLREFIEFFNTIPTTKPELDGVEKEIKMMEDMMSTLDYFVKEKNKILKEIEHVKEIIEGIPIGNSSLCESAISEPKNIEP